MKGEKRLKKKRKEKGRLANATKQPAEGKGRVGRLEDGRNSGYLWNSLIKIKRGRKKKKKKGGGVKEREIVTV